MTDSLPDNDTPGTERPQVSAVPTPGAQAPAPANARAETAETNEAIEASEATRFEDVVSGRYDADEQSPDLALAKRVLAPQPETPKLHKVLAQAGLGSRLEMEQLITDSG